MPLGTGHLWIVLLVLVVVLIIWGPSKLPDVGAGLGRAIREFRSASTETTSAFHSAVNPDQPAAAAPPAPAAAPAAPVAVADKPDSVPPA